MTGLLLDTHTWLWVQRGEAGELSTEFIGELDRQQHLGQVFVSAISVLEIARLVAFGQFDLGISVEDFVDAATEEGGLKILDLSPRILIDSTRLLGVIHRDASDRLIVATARSHGLTLVTRDKQLLAYAKQGHIIARKP